MSGKKQKIITRATRIAQIEPARFDKNVLTVFHGKN